MMSVKRNALIIQRLLYLTVALLFIKILLPAEAAASINCINNGGGNYSVNGGDITWGSDVPVGTNTVKYDQAVGNGYYIDCNSPDVNADRDIFLTLKVDSPAVPGYPGVYQTNVPGIGVKYLFSISQPMLSPHFCELPSDSIIPAGSLRFRCHIMMYGTPKAGIGASVQFVKIGPVDASTVISSIPSVRVTLEYNSIAGFFPMPNMYSGAANTPVNITGGKTCVVTTPNINVPMGRISTRDFTGVGSHAGERDVILEVDCLKSPLMSIALYGQAQDPTTLAVTGGATGVGIQVLVDNQVVQLGPNIPHDLGFGAASGIRQVYLGARYIQTLPKITPGTANATATFSMTYR